MLASCKGRAAKTKVVNALFHRDKKGHLVLKMPDPKLGVSKAALSSESFSDTKKGLGPILFKAKFNLNDVQLQEAGHRNPISLSPIYLVPNILTNFIVEISLETLLKKFYSLQNSFSSRSLPGEALLQNMFWRSATDENLLEFFYWKNLFCKSFDVRPWHLEKSCVRP